MWITAIGRGVPTWTPELPVCASRRKIRHVREFEARGDDVMWRVRDGRARFCFSFPVAQFLVLFSERLLFLLLGGTSAEVAPVYAAVGIGSAVCRSRLRSVRSVPYPTAMILHKKGNPVTPRQLLPTHEAQPYICSALTDCLSRDGGRQHTICVCFWKTDAEASDVLT